MVPVYKTLLISIHSIVLLFKKLDEMSNNEHINMLLPLGIFLFTYKAVPLSSLP